jgi:hypothetical protein
LPKGEATFRSTTFSVFGGVDTAGFSLDAQSGRVFSISGKHENLQDHPEI